LIHFQIASTITDIAKFMEINIWVISVKVVLKLFNHKMISDLIILMEEKIGSLIFLYAMSHPPILASILYVSYIES
jgi:hypothetical protein